MEVTGQGTVDSLQHLTLVPGCMWEENGPWLHVGGKQKFYAHKEMNSVNNFWTQKTRTSDENEAPVAALHSVQWDPEQRTSLLYAQTADLQKLSDNKQLLF